MDWRQRLMQSHGHKGKEAGGKDITAHHAQLFIYEGKYRENPVRQHGAHRLDDEKDRKAADYQHKQRADKGIDDIRHDPAYLFFQESEENACDKRG